MVDNLYVNEKEKNGQPGVDDDGNGFVDDVNGYNFVEATDVVGGTIEPDDEGHGTHVAGTVADNGAVICQNSWGYSSTAGVTEMPEMLKEAIDYFIKNAGCDASGQQKADSPMKG